MRRTTAPDSPSWPTSWACSAPGPRTTTAPARRSGWARTPPAPTRWPGCSAWPPRSTWAAHPPPAEHAGVTKLGNRTLINMRVNSHPGTQVNRRPAGYGGSAGQRHLAATARAPAPRFYPTRSLMRIGASLFLIAVGAILTFAVTADVNGLDLSTIGVILMIVGAAGLLITIAMLSTRRRTDIIHRRTGTTVIEPNDPID